MAFPTNFLSLLKLHSKCTDSLVKEVSGLCPREIEFTTDPFRITVRKMVNSVLAENHMMKAFVRLKPQGERILYGYMRPEHDIWQMVGAFFANRFPGTIIVLGNNTRSWISFNDGKNVKHAQGKSLNLTLQEMEARLGQSDSEYPELLWDTYYWSQYRPEAKNTKYFKHNMPEKYTREAGIRAETDSGGTTLDQFTV
ncbi:MAG: DUF4130 domain-containing protein [Thermoplasmata archaeon]|nr:DUF4130 domain-containing protein [Thermoplasmata archaeon]